MQIALAELSRISSQTQSSTLPLAGALKFIFIAATGRSSLSPFEITASAYQRPFVTGFLNWVFERRKRHVSRPDSGWGYIQPRRLSVATAAASLSHQRM